MNDSFTVPPTSLTALPEDQRLLALERFHLLQPHLEQGASLAATAKQGAIPYRTAQRWVSLFRRFGLTSLARKGRTDRGGRRVLSPTMQKLVEGLVLQRPPIPIATLYRQVCRVAVEQGQKPPSYSVVYDVVRKLPGDLVTLAQEGANAYADSFELVHRREAERSNAIWQADHTLLDFLVLREDATTAKPWLTTVIDDYSRAIAGYFLSFNAPSALQTALALRQAIWRKGDARWQVCGIPEILYTDNGSDFTSQHLEQVAADLKIQLVFSLPGKPRGRGRIERFFSTLSQMCLSGLPGYTPPGTTAVRGEPTLSLEDLDGHLKAFLLDTYHTRPHGETKIAPQERWHQGGFLPQMPDSLEQLDLLLLTVAKARKVHPDGVRFQGLRYVDTTLAAYIGELVILRYDPRDLAEVRLFHEGQFLCRAICPELAGATIPLKEVLRARNQRRRDLRATIQDRKKTVDALLDLKRGQEENTSNSEENISNSEASAQTQVEPPKLPLEPPKPPRLRRYINE